MDDLIRRSVGCLIAVGAAEAATRGESLSDLRTPTGGQRWPGRHTRLAFATLLGLTRAHLRLLERGIGSPGAVVARTYEPVLSQAGGTWLGERFETLAPDDRDRELVRWSFDWSSEAPVDDGPDALPRVAVVGLLAETGSAGHVAGEVRRLSHEGPAAELSAAFVGSLVALLLDGETPLRQAIPGARKQLGTERAGEVRRRMRAARRSIDEREAAAAESTGDELDVFDVLALALQAVMEHADVESTILWAVDRQPSVPEVAILAATLSALVHGPDALPVAWWESDLAAVAEQLVTDARAVAHGYTPDETSWSTGIPGEVLRRVHAF